MASDGGTVSAATVGNPIAYANYVAEVLLAGTVGSVPTIPNDLASAELDTDLLLDPVVIEAIRASVADQMNAQSGGPRFEDLSERIADIQIADTAQGAGTLTLSIIDPLGLLGLSGFIQTDENGYIWPPIDINFPDGTDCYWRTCQYADSLDLTEPNITLTFEDRIVSMLRQMSPLNGLTQGTDNQSLVMFFKMLIDSTNAVLKPDPKIRFSALVSTNDPNYAAIITDLPKSVKLGSRKNPNKTDQGLTGAQTDALNGFQAAVAELFGGVTSTTMGSIEAQSAGGRPGLWDPGTGLGR